MQYKDDNRLRAVQISRWRRENRTETVVYVRLKTAILMPVCQAHFTANIIKFRDFLKSEQRFCISKIRKKCLFIDKMDKFINKKIVVQYTVQVQVHVYWDNIYIKILNLYFKQNWILPSFHCFHDFLLWRCTVLHTALTKFFCLRYHMNIGK